MLPVNCKVTCCIPLPEVVALMLRSTAMFLHLLTQSDNFSEVMIFMMHVPPKKPDHAAAVCIDIV